MSAVEDRSVEDRLELLEAIMRELVSIERDNNRLADGVERLAEETGGLNVILRQVDEQQQRLSTLGRDLERVERATATKAEVNATATETRRQLAAYRKRVLERAMLIGVVALALLGALGVSAANYVEAQHRKDVARQHSAYATCVDTNKRVRTVRHFLVSETQYAATTEIRKSAQEALGAFPEQDCGAAK